MLPRRLELRGLARILLALGDEIVDVLLVGGHILHVVLEEHGLPRVTAGGRILDKLLDAVGIGVVGVHALLQHRAERTPELVVPLRVFLDRLERREHLRRHRALDLRDHRVVLQHLARDVQRQIRAVHHALHEPQPTRQQHLDVVADEDVAHVERKPALLLGHEEIHRRLLRNEEQGLELHLPLAGERNRLERLVPVVGEVLVELGVFLRLHILLRPLPERRHRVERLLLVLLATLAVFLLLVGENVNLAESDRIGDEIGIFLHKFANPPLIEILALIVAQVQHHARAVAVADGIGNRVAPTHVGLPLERRVLSALLRHDAHLVRHHERRVEPDAELTDQFGQVLAALLLQSLAERLRPRTRDRAEVLFEIRRVHSHAVVGNHDGFCGFIDRNVNFPRRIVRHERLVGQTEELGAVNRVGSVGNEFPKEDFLL